MQKCFRLLPVLCRFSSKCRIFLLGQCQSHLVSHQGYLLSKALVQFPTVVYHPCQRLTFHTVRRVFFGCWLSNSRTQASSAPTIHVVSPVPKICTIFQADSSQLV